MFDRIVMNLVSATKRYETLEGRQFLVVPTVMTAEGVWNGSQGPLYYPAQELAKNPQAWNHRPIVVYHPMLNGEGASACDPTIVEQQRVGVLFNTIYDSKLRTESWLDVEKLRKVDPRVLTAMENNETMEVSTGLFHDCVNETGTWNGKAYIGTVINIQPDHLAILPDQKGSYSVQDGGGLLRNAAAEGMSYDDIREQLKPLIRARLGADSYAYVMDLYAKAVVYESGDNIYRQAYKSKEGKVALDGEPEKVRRVVSYVTNAGQIIKNDDNSPPVAWVPPSADQLSAKLRMQQMQKALEEKYSPATEKSDWGGWVCDLQPDSVIWWKDGLLFRLPYAYNDDKIRFVGDLQELEPPTYVPRRQTPPVQTSPFNVNRQGNNMPPAPAPAVKPTPQPTSNVIHQGTSTLFSGTDAGANGGPALTRESLMATMPEALKPKFTGMTDSDFSALMAWVTMGANDQPGRYSYDGIRDRSNVHNTTSLTPEQYIEQAPPAMRGVLRNGLAAYEQERQQLVSRILTNKACRFTREFLLTKEPDELRGLADMAAPIPDPIHQPTMNYGGQANVPMYNQNVQTDQPVEGKPLPIPQMTF